MKRMWGRMKTRLRKKDERGVALFMALFALLLLSAIAMGMMFMSTTETEVNYNYRDAQQAYFASQAGLEVVRDAMRANDNLIPIDLPALGNATGVLYVLNPNGGETVDPTDPKNPYFDYELCHEYGKNLGLTDPGWKVPCTEGAPAGAYKIVSNQVQPINNGSVAHLDFKWVRITLKQNFTTPYPVNSGAASDTQVCWDDQLYNQHLINAAENRMPFPEMRPDRPMADFELAALRKAVDMGLGTQAVFAFGAKGKSTTTGTTTGTSTTGTSTTGTSTTGTSTTGTSTTGTSTTGTSTTGTSTTGTSTTGTSTTGTSTTGTSTTGTSTTGTSTTAGTGYYARIDNCQKTNANRFAIYMITSMAVTKKGSRRLTQFEATRQPFPPVPGGLTMNGPAANFQAPNSMPYYIDGKDHAVNDLNASPPGTCPGKGVDKHAILTGDQTGVDNAKTSIDDANRDTHYIGLGGDTPNVYDGSTDPDLAKWGGPSEHEDIVDQFWNIADSTVDAAALGKTEVTDADLVARDPNCQNYVLGTAANATTNPAYCAGPKVTVIKGDLTLSGNPHGYGILVVTGTLTFTGNFSYDGAVLVIGKGEIIAKGGGAGEFNGGVYVAKTRADDGSLLGSLGTPKVDWSGGGGNGIYYNSCLINNALSGSAFRVIAYREITY